MSDNTMINIVEQTTEPPVYNQYDRRTYPRLEVTDQSFWIWEDIDGVKTRLKFNVVNVSRNGMCIGVGSYHMLMGSARKGNLILTPPNGVSRIYPIETFCIWSHSGKAGLRLKIIWNGVIKSEQT